MLPVLSLADQTTDSPRYTCESDAVASGNTEPVADAPTFVSSKNSVETGYLPTSDTVCVSKPSRGKLGSAEFAIVRLIRPPLPLPSVTAAAVELSGLSISE